MRRTCFLSGKSGHGWYEKFLKEGQQGFKKYNPPTPFDWTKGSVARTKVYFDMKMEEESLGRLIFELADDVVPKTVENFKSLCTQNNANKFTYNKTKFHQIVKGQVAMGGDVEMKDGTLSHSAGTDRFFKDENFIIPHTSRGLLR